MNKTNKNVVRSLKELRRIIFKKANQKKAEHLQRFFKTGEGEYGEGDIFLGITVSVQRQIAKEYLSLDFTDLSKMIASRFHEERLICLLILVSKFEKGGAREQKEIFQFYIKNTQNINNWDLVDLSAPKIVGPYLEDKNRALLYKLAKSKDIWQRRIAMLSTFCYIRQGDAKDALKIAEILKYDEHDLIQKAVGWMLREVGKNCGEDGEEKFLNKYYKKMPRTMLRYAIERFPEKKRQHYLK